MTELMLADGPTRYLGGSIESFALPYGAFIVIAGLLYLIFKRPHSVPRMRYLQPGHQTATGTREPGTAGVIRVRGPVPASAAVAEAETGVPGLQPPHASETLQDPDVLPESANPAPANPESANPESANPAPANPAPESAHPAPEAEGDA